MEIGPLPICIQILCFLKDLLSNGCSAFQTGSLPFPYFVPLSTDVSCALLERQNFTMILSKNLTPLIAKIDRKSVLNPIIYTFCLDI